METVKLLKDWTDASGVAHSAGETVTVNSATAKALIDSGTAASVGSTAGTDGVGPT